MLNKNKIYIKKEIIHYVARNLCIKGICELIKLMELLLFFQKNKT
jgi:hypothetical protein